MFTNSETEMNQTAKTHTIKFIRRKELTPNIRMLIAVLTIYAKMTKRWGLITRIARQFYISRTFVYMLSAILIETGTVAFGYSDKTAAINEKKISCELLLSLRLEGRCSIESVSSIMKRLYLPCSSTGFISEALTELGSLLPDTLDKGNGDAQQVIFLSDELFSKNCPILITVDPVSSAILRIELSETRTSEDWKKHWECLEKNGFYAVYLVSDQGRSLCKAQKEALSHTFRQPDTYHTIAHQLGKWVGIFENAAYSAIETEYDRYEKLDSAKSDSIILKRIEDYENARNIAAEKIDQYENFRFLYHSLVTELNVFDSNGNLRDRYEAENNLKAGLDLLETLRHSEITKIIIRIRRTLHELLNYFKVAEEIVTGCHTLAIDQKALQALCLAWQWNKATIKTDNSVQKKLLADNEQFCQDIATGYLQDDFEIIKEQIYGRLDRIVQSSALVECINSIIRPYCNNFKNHINQETLNLIMFYHNHRRYKDGKRKGKTPMEILTGKSQDKDWIELLMDIAEKKDPSFFI